MKALEHDRLANNGYQQAYRENLDTLGLCRITAIVSKECKKTIDMYAARTGQKKKDILTEVIKIGVDHLGIA